MPGAIGEGVSDEDPSLVSSQLPYIVDMAIQEFAGKVGMPVDVFSAVARDTKDARPSASDNEAVYSKNPH